jgi:hypothetical protein
LSDDSAPRTVRLQDGATETRKVEALGWNERIGYGSAAVLCRRSGRLEMVALHVRRMGQSPEKPNG